MKFFSTLVASTLGVLIASGIMFVVFVLFIIGIAASSNPRPVVRNGSVLRFDLSGTIPERGAADALTATIRRTEPYGVQDIVRSIRNAEVDSRIAGIWLRSGGLATSWASLQEIRSALEDFKASGKPIIASVRGGTLGENEYFLLTAADSIFGLPNAPVEFNGFYINAEFYKRALDKLSVEPQIIRAGKFKSAVEPFLRSSLSDENRQQLSTILEMHRRVFLETVAAARGLDVATVAGLLDGTTIITSEDALAAGLIDQTAYGDEARAAVARAIGATTDDFPVADIESYSALSTRDVGRSENARNEIAVLYVDGAIVGGTSQDGSSVGSESLGRTIKTLADRESVKAVVLRINSPGGSSTASDEMLHDLSGLASKKPLVASMSGVAASGGYWIAMAADSIVAEPLTITGSIGVYSMFFDVGDLFSEKLGIDFDVVQTGKNADMLSGFRSLSMPEREALQRSVDATYARFLILVSENRMMPVDRIDELAQGRVWTGQDAKDRNLVDVLGSLDDAVAIAAGMAGLDAGDYASRSYPTPAPFWQQLSERMNASVLAKLPKQRLTALEREAIERARTIETILQDFATVQTRMPLTITVQ